MTLTLADISRATGLELHGDAGLTIRNPSEPANAGKDDLALAMNKSYADAVRAGHARAAVLWDGADWAALGLQGALYAPKARVALAAVTDLFQHPAGIERGVHPSAVIDPSAVIGAGAAIGPFVVVGARARIGDGAQIDSHVSIGADAVVGAGALLHAGVRIGARCTIGDRFVAQPNAVVGADGFSFEPPQRGAVEQARQTGSVDGAARLAGFLRIHSLAAVEIGDDVEIGAGTTIDRGTIAPTRIGSGTKIDNQVQIGHNVQIGQLCLICAHVGIAGSCRIDDRVVLGGKVGVADHVHIASDVICAGGTLVAGNVAAKSVMMGVPGTTRDQAMRQVMAIKRLPRMLDQFAAMKEKLGL